MSTIDTFVNYRSSVHNKATARNTAATAANTAAAAASLERMETAERHRDLRDRGLIDHTSTPSQIAGVERTLAAEMRARIDLEGNAAERHPYRATKVTACVFAAFVWIEARADTTSGDDHKWWWIMLVVVLAACALNALRIHASEERRALVVARVTVGADGSCGWCGEPAAGHVLDNGEPAHPRLFHAVEIEHELARI